MTAFEYDPTEPVRAPLDCYDPWQPPEGVDAFQRSLVLGAYPAGSEIVEVRSYRPGYVEYPVRVAVRLPGGETSACAVKASPLIGGVEREGRLLPALARYGLAAPAVLAGPVEHPGYPNAGPLVVLSELPGTALPWIEVTLEEADRTVRLHRQAIARLHALTEPLLRDEVASALPQRTLLDELAEIVDRGGPWLEAPLFREAVARLKPVLEAVETPLVFSNGDYNPLNFLHQGDTLTGWLDFTHACFEDPYVGLAKFQIWGFDRLGWGTGVQAGLVERFLYHHNVTRAEFAPRLALRCLYRLQRDTSVAGERDRFYRQEILKWLRLALAEIGR
jgi:hypothetical protein